MRKLLGLILGLMLISACAASSLAQDKDKAKSKARTVTGCVSKGDSPDEYKLTAKDGSTWELRSSTEAMTGKTANLAEHVGHTVTVTGTVEKAKMEMKEEEKAKEGGMKHEQGSEPKELKVISIKHVSNSCS